MLLINELRKQNKKNRETKLPRESIEKHSKFLISARNVSFSVGTIQPKIESSETNRRITRIKSGICSTGGHVCITNKQMK